MARFSLKKKKKNTETSDLSKFMLQLSFAWSLRQFTLKSRKICHTEAFMVILTRFVTSRGLSGNINSDNGKNFEGTNNDLNELYIMLNSYKTKEKIHNFSGKNQINCHFIPPKAPNFSGLWESVVTHFKYHCKRVAHDKKFTFCEFITFYTEVEAILNSRPVTPMSTDINDLSVLTPEHFHIDS